MAEGGGRGKRNVPGEQLGKLLVEIAEILGKEEDAVKYSKIAEQTKKAFRHIATNDGKIISDRQAEYVRAIAFDLLTEEEKEQAAADLNELVVKNGYHLNTGFLSTPMGAITGWLFAGICGIQVKDGRITIRPLPYPLLQHAKASYQSPLGKIVSGWRYEGDEVFYEIEIPSNTEAEVILPDGRKEVLGAGSYRL